MDQKVAVFLVVLIAGSSAWPVERDSQKSTNMNRRRQGGQGGQGGQSGQGGYMGQGGQGGQGGYMGQGGQGGYMGQGMQSGQGGPGGMMGQGGQGGMMGQGGQGGMMGQGGPGGMMGQGGPGGLISPANIFGQGDQSGPIDQFGPENILHPGSQFGPGLLMAIPDEDGEPVTIDEVKELASLLKAVMIDFTNVLESNANNIESAANQDDEAFVDALGDYIDDVLEIGSTDFVQLQGHLMRLMPRAAAYGILDEPGCTTQQECIQRQQEKVQLFTQVYQEVKSELEQKRNECEQLVQVTGRRRGGPSGAGGRPGAGGPAGAGGAPGATGMPADQFVEIMSKLKEGLQELTGSNAELGSKIYSVMSCFAGQLQQFASEIQPENIPTDTKEIEQGIARLMMYTYEIVQQNKRIADKLKEIKHFKEFTPVSNDDIEEFYNSLSDSIDDIKDNFNDVVDILKEASADEPDVSDVFEKLSDIIPETAFEVVETKEMVAALLARTTVLGYEGNPSCAEYFSLDTFSEFESCAKDAFVAMQAKELQIRQELVSTVGQNNPDYQCNNIKNELANLQSSMQDINSVQGNTGAPGNPQAQALEDLKDMASSKLPAVVLADVQCFGENLERLISSVDFEGDDFQKTLLQLVTVEHVLETTIQRVLSNIKRVATAQIMHERIEDVSGGGGVRKMMKSARSLSQSMQSSLKDLSFNKIARDVDDNDVSYSSEDDSSNSLSSDLSEEHVDTLLGQLVKKLQMSLQRAEQRKN